MQSQERLLDELCAGYSEAKRFKLQRVLTLIRLLRDDAHGGGREIAGQWEGVRNELKTFSTRRAVALLEVLVLHVLVELLPTDTFLDPGPARLSWHGAWNQLEILRARDPGLPEVPRPGEAREQTFDRLLEALQERGAGAVTLARLRAMRAHLDGPEKAQEAWRAVLAVLRKEGESGPPNPRAVTAALRGLCAATFERCDARAVRDLCERSPALFDPKLSWMHVWATLLCGEESRARDLARDLEPFGGPLPSSLEELRGRHSPWADLLPGRARAQGTKPREFACDSRRRFSAAVFAVFALDERERLVVLALDSSPGLGDAPLERARERRGAWRRTGEPEHELLSTALSVYRLAAMEGGPRSRPRLRGALGSGSAALVLVPIWDGDHEVAGWVHLECEHALLPSEARLASVARAWRTGVAEVGRSLPRCGGETETLSARPMPSEKQKAARRLIAGLGLKLARRRVLLLEYDGETDEPALVSAVGQAFVGSPGCGGGRRALARARRTRGAVFFDRPGSAPGGSLGWHAEACSGAVVPLEIHGRRMSFLVCESTRRGDQPLREERVRGMLAGLAKEWRAACFRDVHRERHGFEPAFDPNARFWSTRALELRALATAQEPICIVGPAGAGKEFLARYLDFEGALCDTPMRVVRAEGLDVGALRELAAKSLEGPGECRPGLCDGERLFLLSREPVAALLERLPMPRPLSEVLERTAVEIPPLADRRDEIPGLVLALAKRFANAQGAEPVRFSARALELLWRQPWPGNLSQLSGLLYKLALSFPGEEVSAEAIRHLGHGSSEKLRLRMPSLRPRRIDLELALSSSRNACGTRNKTGAARWLGWDPDTLTRRLEERGLTGHETGPEK